MPTASAPNWLHLASSSKTSPTVRPSGGGRDAVAHSLSAPGGGEGWGEVGDCRAPADTHLPLPPLPFPPPQAGEGWGGGGPLPLRPEGRRGEFRAAVAMAGTDHSREGA